mmetsp:Transcript_17972/g.41148  ORF Transcript_17972/g.41148 Transcript_17972/m.41148 type:complete len:223 (+) Transcript_17972:219-887(+)
MLSGAPVPSLSFLSHVRTRTFPQKGTSVPSERAFSSIDSLGSSLCHASTMPRCFAFRISSNSRALGVSTIFMETLLTSPHFPPGAAAAIALARGSPLERTPCLKESELGSRSMMGRTHSPRGSSSSSRSASKTRIRSASVSKGRFTSRHSTLLRSVHRGFKVRCFTGVRCVQDCPASLWFFASTRSMMMYGSEVSLPDRIDLSAAMRSLAASTLTAMVLNFM